MPRDVTLLSSPCSSPPHPRLRLAPDAHRLRRLPARNHHPDPHQPRRRGCRRHRSRRQPGPRSQLKSQTSSSPKSGNSPAGALPLRSTSPSLPPAPPEPPLDLPPGTFTNYTPHPASPPPSTSSLSTPSTPPSIPIRPTSASSSSNTSAPLLQPASSLAIFGLTTHLILLQGFTDDPADPPRRRRSQIPPLLRSAR